ncbi:hypothetical protein MRX96_039978 [Rhipicephalus microplus]
MRPGRLSVPLQLGFCANLLWIAVLLTAPQGESWLSRVFETVARRRGPVANCELARTYELRTRPTYADACPLLPAGYLCRL